MNKRCFLILLISLIPFSAESQNIFRKKTVLIEDQLKELNIPFTTDREGDFKLKIQTGSSEPRTVWLRKATNSFHGENIREIFSIAAVYRDKPVPQKLTKYLLMDNYKDKYMGSWAIIQKDDTYLIVFLVKIPQDVSSSYIMAALKETAEAAAALEKSLKETGE